MFIGHFAPAFLARGISEDAPRLGVLFIGAQLTDWALFTLTLGGIERVRIVPGITAMNPLDLYYMPYTHSILGTALWAMGFAALIWLGTRSLVAASWAAFVVASHWVLDLLVTKDERWHSGFRLDRFSPQGRARELHGVAVMCMPPGRNRVSRLDCSSLLGQPDPLLHRGHPKRVPWLQALRSAGGTEGPPALHGALLPALE